MAECFVEVLLDAVPRREIRGIHLKGSSLKHWDSPLDYVPEVSDVDMHILFHKNDAWPQHLGTVAQAIDIQKQVERLYFSKISEPLHTPRPQLIVLNQFLQDRDRDFVGSPPGAVEVLYGEEPDPPDYQEPDRIRRGECIQTIKDAGHLEALPMQVIDKPGRYLWQSLRDLTWRVSPAGPRVLHISGLGTADVWSLNRTAVVAKLNEAGRHCLADDYAAFYMFAWDYFLSRYENNEAGRYAIGAGARVLTQASEIAADWLAGHPEN